MNTYSAVGIMIGSPFSTLVLTRIQPRYWLPLCTMLWSFCVLGTYAAQNVETVYALRFCAGLFESVSTPGVYYIGSWYRRSEISRRIALFGISAGAGPMFSSYIQAGLYRNMNNRNGLASWRWLFIFDFILGMPVALLGFLTCPAEPRSHRIWWMTEKEQQISVRRLAEQGRDAESVEWSFSMIKRLVSCWQLYCFPLAWGLLQLSCGQQISTWMRLWLKSLTSNGKPRYSVEQINTLPTVINALEIVWMLLAGYIVDTSGKRTPTICALALLQLTTYAVLAAWPSDEHVVMAMFFLGSATGGIAPLLSSWLNYSCGGNKELRALASALMFSLGYAMGNVQLKIYPANQGPKFKETHGYVFGLVWIAAFIIWVCVALPNIQKRYHLKESESDSV
ncbi:major facilitator superfamily domain-containing protein [Boeremia exigua]|uniref:major facilitator superfamily domain-containing protein n=1 Tax=Boeremia exigua TaxID=749465 RepID=UPI001E8D4EAB|nr:major facilitator superfamily domain-containing protein [Boeremia exigua]KAH6638878.1 major facilitator superfamily domain-containing protein [Boeremia exigua]